MGLRDLVLPAQMSKGADDIAGDFYLPSMRQALVYDRVAGYFSSAVYLLAWPALRGFADRGGRIRIICSPSLARTDVEGLDLGYRARSEADLAETLLQELSRMLGDEHLTRPTRALAGLVASGVVDVRLAFLEPAAPAGSKRIFHDKVGIFRDASGDRIGFRGTMNETYLGLSPDGNLESIDIFPSWVGGRDAERLIDAESRFEHLWANEVPYARVRPFPDLVLAELRRTAAEAPWEVLADQLAAQTPEPSEPVAAQAVRLRCHQVDALTAWEANGNRGILAHATGSGKTATAIEAIRRRLGAGEAPVIIVPTEALLVQWDRTLREQLRDLAPKILLCGAGNDHWRDPGLLRAWVRRAGSEPRIVLAVVNTAATPSFLDAIDPWERVFLVGDEAHRLGSLTFRGILQRGGVSRLGLSATPERAGDQEGTAEVMGYFGGVVHTYSLAEAIHDGYLTPYTYDPHLVELTAEEQSRWSDLTVRLRRRYGRIVGALGAEAALQDDRVRLLLIQRARIVKGAVGKVELAAGIVSKEFRPGQSWLVYCDTQAQLRLVQQALRERGFHPVEYHSAMSGDEAQTLRELTTNGGILVAIHCLDEGVDIPTATHALILASSRNPREFIQRRGRVLRPSPRKTISHVHDAIVLPAPSGAASSSGDFERAIWAELARAMEFASTAINPESRTRLERLCIRFGLDVRELGALGFEDDATNAPTDTRGIGNEQSE